MKEKTHKRQWRQYQTASGNKPVEKYLDELSLGDRGEIVAAMADVRRNGRGASKHLRGDIYEIIADGRDESYRLLFSAERKFHHVLLALEAFSKKTRKAPKLKIEVAEKRLKDWRARGRAARKKP